MENLVFCRVPKLTQALVNNVFSGCSGSKGCHVSGPLQEEIEFLSQYFQLLEILAGTLPS